MIFDTNKLHKATNEMVLTFFINFCSPEGDTKLSTFSALYRLYTYSLLYFFVKKAMY